MECQNSVKRLNVALVSLNYFEIVHYYNAVDAIL